MSRTKDYIAATIYIYVYILYIYIYVFLVCTVMFHVVFHLCVAYLYTNISGSCFPRGVQNVKLAKTVRVASNGCENAFIATWRPALGARHQVFSVWRARRVSNKARASTSAASKWKLLEPKPWVHTPNKLGHFGTPFGTHWGTLGHIGMSCILILTSYHILGG